MAPLFFRCPDDAEAWDIDDQYFLGRTLLVAPIMEPGLIAREVYLPGGAWEDMWTGETTHGPVRIDVPAPIEQIPVFRLATGPWPFRMNPFIEESKL